MIIIRKLRSTERKECQEGINESKLRYFIFLILNYSNNYNSLQVMKVTMYLVILA